MQKYVNLVDLVKSFPTTIYLQKSASIQPRTSPLEFGGKFNSISIRVLRPLSDCLRDENEQLELVEQPDFRSHRAVVSTRAEPATMQGHGGHMRV